MQLWTAAILHLASLAPYAVKEARETDYWLKLCKRTAIGSSAELGRLIGECWQITAILVTSIKTAKRNGGIDEPRLRKENAERKADSREQN